MRPATNRHGARFALAPGKERPVTTAPSVRGFAEPPWPRVLQPRADGTTGLPKNKRAPASDFENWPRIVQLAWAAYDARGRLTAAESHIVRPDGFTIPDDATRVHGISTAQASRDGRDVRKVLELFAMVIRGAEILVSHNMPFDENVVAAETYRIGQPIDLQSKVRVCTKVTSTAHCQIPGQYGFKWPKLSELSAKLFGRELLHAHDAAADVAACAECFFELKRLGVIRIKGKE